MKKMKAGDLDELGGVGGEGLLGRHGHHVLQRVVRVQRQCVVHRLISGFGSRVSGVRFLVPGFIFRFSGLGLKV